MIVWIVDGFNSRTTRLKQLLVSVYLATIFLCYSFGMNGKICSEWVIEEVVKGMYIFTDTTCIDLK